MDIHSLSWTMKDGWQVNQKGTPAQSQWVLYFGSREALEASKAYDYLKTVSPSAVLMGCSTGGEIMADEVLDDSVVAVCVTFQKTRVDTFQMPIAQVENSYDLGKQITARLNKPGLRNIFVLADGLHINGNDLVRGIFEDLPESVKVTGGLAGDADQFKLTEVGMNDKPTSKNIAAIGFYSDSLKVGYGSVGGWNPFGPERRVTRAKGNVVYELDGVPALDLYKSYLGEEAGKLPGSGLLYPLSIRAQDSSPKSALVRTIIAVDEAEKSVTFVGDIPEGYLATLMRGNFDNLIEGAGHAAGLAKPDAASDWELAILVSCIGRKLLLGQRISDETEAVADILGATPTIGFYSYGEICHHQFTQKCEFHNQTMTVTVFSEK